MTALDRILERMDRKLDLLVSEAEALKNDAAKSKASAIALLRMWIKK